MNGVSAVPNAASTTPAASTGVWPNRSASAPAIGCTAPQTNCAIANAKLIATMPSPVDVFSGDTNNPIDWRAPMVITNSDAASKVTVQKEFVDGRVPIVNFVPVVQRDVCKSSGVPY